MAHDGRWSGRAWDALTATGDGWTLDISEARSGGTGPESNRDKARRGGWGTGEVLSVGAARGSVMTVIHRREDGALVVSGSDGVDRVTAPGEIRTPEDADRLFGVGFGLGRWMRENAGAAVLDVAPVKVEQPDPAPGQVCHATPADFGALPNPASGQVWTPPAGEWADRFVDADGTVTVATADGTTVTFVGGGGCKDANMDGPAGGWTCVGVATPHGRVMVGDAFRFDDGPEITVVRVLDHDSHVAMSNGHAHVAGWLLAFGKRTRYAPARVGERYRWRTTGAVETVESGPDGALQTRSEHGVRPMRGLRGVSGATATFDPAVWERLDPGAAAPAHKTLAETIEMANELRRKLRETSGVEPVQHLTTACAVLGQSFPEKYEPSATAQPSPSTLTLAAPARDLRALFDAIGRALESAAPEIVTFGGQPLSVLRSDGCTEPSVHGGTIDANARDLCVLRAAVAQALAIGRSYACAWDKGRTLTVERVGGPLVTAQPASAEHQATHYDGAQGGPDAWRWEVGE